MKIKTACRNGDIIVLNTNHGQYRYSRNELLAAENLGHVIASSFTGRDRQTGRMLMDIYIDAVREVLDA